MSDKEDEVSADEQRNGSANYEAPEVESVVTAKDLHREVQYAGNQSAPPP